MQTHRESQMGKCRQIVMEQTQREGGERQRRLFDKDLKRRESGVEGVG